MDAELLFGEPFTAANESLANRSSRESNDDDHLQWFGGRSMEAILWVVAVVALLMLVGQYFAGMSDYYLSIENPRPLDENETVITSKWWGFMTQTGSSRIAELAGQGLSDVRVYATRTQMLATILTFGWRRSITVAWRGNAGQHPLGEA